jgi:hypothetical protein
LWSSEVRGMILIGFLLVGACASPRQVLEVKQLHLRDASISEGFDRSEAEVMRGEKLRHFYGAVTAEERQGRLGDYYSVSWEGPEGTEGEEVRLVFEYQQAATGSAIKTMEQKFPGKRVGTGEFVLNGEAYARGGRVLAWRVKFYRGSNLMASRHSYLWE